MRSFPSSLGILDLKPRAKNQDLLRSLWGILVLGFGSEIPRFVQESWGNLGSWFLVLVRKFQDLFRSPGEIVVLGSWFWFGNSKICSGVLGESWFLVLGFSRGCILNAFFTECRECILNALFPECYH